MNCFRLPLLLTTAITGFAATPLPYAPQPDDPYWNEEWYLENIDDNGTRAGIDLNARSAWSISRGAGVTIAIVDDGVELNHPDLANQARSDLHWNFASDTPDGAHPSDARMHGTPVAGLAVAQANNALGISGMAPESRFASWIIYKTNNIGGPFVNTNQLARMFRFHNDEVQIQNHSWVVPGGAFLVNMSSVENDAIEDAVRNGRQGRGVVIVRAAGNDRLDARNGNDDAYVADARAISVAALRPDGIVSSYSTPGAPILVSAPGGELGIGTLFTTDRIGRKGYNQISFPDDPALSDYVFSGLGFYGTSAAAPLISGTVALMLSTNPSLGYRDVQQILIHSAYQTHLDDPDLQTNSAGFVVGHNSGFGLVNAGTAVDLARQWKNRPPLTNITATVEGDVEIVDGGLLLAVEPLGEEEPNLGVLALPGLGIHVDQGTPRVPLVYVGTAATPLDIDLTGKAALIQRGATNFAAKIIHAANAGAIFAAIFNDRDTDQAQVMGGTDYVPIPAISITQEDGENLTNILDRFGAEASIVHRLREYTFEVSEPLLCEQVKVTLNATHQQRGDLRLTLVSPGGTKSVLQRFGQDQTAFPGQWTYMTTHHFYESSQGTWKLQFSDEAIGGTGVVHNASLEILGVPIKDDDRDGLDDDWEIAQFNTLEHGPKDDPDADGYSNAREQILLTNPAQNENPLALDLSVANDSTIRLSWPSRPGVQYEVLTSPEAGQPLTRLTELAGGFPRTAWFGKATNRFQYFMVREKP